MGDLTYTANWTANTYTVTLNNQSATTAGTTSVTATYGSAMPSITKPSRSYTVTYNANSGTVSTTSATATYTFGGYYTGTSGSGTQYYTAAGASAKNWDLTSATTLYAKWTSSSVTLPTPTRLGYIFNGWYTAASGGTKVGAAGASYTPTSSLTIYAQWTYANYSVSSPATGASTLTEAGSLANASATIKLQTDNLSDSSSLTITKNLTIDLQGYTITRGAGGIATTATVTIQNGTMTVGENNAFVNYGTLTLSSLTVTSTGSIALLHINTTGTTTVTSCTFKHTGSAGVVYGNPSSTGAISITSSTLAAANSSALLIEGTSNLTINANVSSPKYCLGFSNASTTTSTVNVTGGNYLTYSTNNTLYTLSGSNVALNISNAKFLNMGTNSAVAIGSSAATTIRSGYIVSTQSIAVWKSGTGTLTLGSTSDTYSNETPKLLAYNQAVGFADSGTLYLNNGSMYSKSASNVVSSNVTVTTSRSGYSYSKTSSNTATFGSITLTDYITGTTYTGSGTSDSYKGYISN